MPVLLRRSTLIAFGALAVLVAGAVRGSAATSALPSLYVDYNTSCHFTMRLDSGAAVTSGTAIPYGQYQLVVTTPIAFSNGQGGCDFINFSMTGPGVSYQTQLGQGDATQEITSQTFASGASYTATDNTVPPGSTITFSASSTPVSPVGSTSSSGTGTSSGASQSPVGSNAGSSSSSALKFKGALAGAVSATGKLTLKFKGKPVVTIAQGQYTLTVSDKSTKAGFIVDGGGHKITVTTPSYKGPKSVTVNIATGQWYYASKAGAAKIYFVATVK